MSNTGPKFVIAPHIEAGVPGLLTQSDEVRNGIETHTGRRRLAASCHGVQQNVVGLVGVALPVGIPPAGVHEPGLSVVPAMLTSFAMPMFAQVKGVGPVIEDTPPAQVPMIPMTNSVQVPPVGALHEHWLHPRVSLSAAYATCCTE
jgi:hypothetical protein